MSIQSEVERLSANVQNTLEAIRQTGVSVPENATCDALPAAAAALANEKQDKLTGASGQIVGFGEDGSAQPEDFPGLTQAQGDERYLPQTGGTVTGQLRLAMTETGGALYFGESISGDDGMITASNGTMGISVGVPTGNRVAIAMRESTGELSIQAKNGTSASNAGNFNFTSDGLNMGMKPITNCPTLDGKQDKLTGAQGQVVGFDAEGNAVAQAAPQTGMTQDQADQRYLQLTGGHASGTIGVASGQGKLELRVDTSGETQTLAFIHTPAGSAYIRNTEGGTIIIGSDSGFHMNTRSKDLVLTGGNFVSATAPSDDDDLTNKAYVDSKTLAFGPQTVATSAWSANTTYSAQGYGFRASVPLSGVTADYIPDVTFAMADAVSGNLAPLADTYAGGIYIYAKEQPSATVNIASVVCTKGA